MYETSTLVTYWSMFGVFAAGHIAAFSSMPSYRNALMEGKEKMSSLFDELKANLPQRTVVRKDDGGEVDVVGPRQSSKKELHAKQERGVNEDRLRATISKNFNILEKLIGKSFDGRLTSLIISGAPGVGKSYPVEKMLQKHASSGGLCTLSKGYARATGVYEILYRNRERGSVAVFDDIDAIFSDEVTLNLFKVALDTTEERKLSWLTSRVPKCSETDERLPKEFVFEGTVIFISNLDFDGIIEKEGKLAPHLEALISRSHYVDMGLRTRAHQFVRIKQIAEEGLFDRLGLDEEETKDVLTFIENNLMQLREASLRMALKVATLRKGGEADWEDEARMTCVKKKKG